MTAAADETEPREVTATMRTSGGGGGRRGAGRSRLPSVC